MKPNDPENIQKLADGKSPAYKEITAEQFLNGKVEIAGEEKTEEYSFAELANGSSVSMKGLVVKSAYTTQSENSGSNGAMTLTCEVDGKTVTVRTVVLRDANGSIITEDAYKGKTIDVKGIIDCYNGEYQIKVFSKDSITVN
jgi:DNA/RNA endonuclease YhcR with UshA esterase domain